MHCERCGSIMRNTGIEVTCLGDAEPAFIQQCPNWWCGSTCRTCRRKAGDVHGPECGPTMARKADFPIYRVSLEDYR